MYFPEEGKCKEYYDDYWIFGDDDDDMSQDETGESSEGSGSGDGSGAGDEMTKEELQALFGEQRCKPEPVDPCVNSTFGCCPDDFHSAAGPFNEGTIDVT